jgi:hypothetical protein
MESKKIVKPEIDCHKVERVAVTENGEETVKWTVKHEVETIFAPKAADPKAKNVNAKVDGFANHLDMKTFNLKAGTHPLGRVHLGNHAGLLAQPGAALTSSLCVPQKPGVGVVKTIRMKKDEVIALT